MLYKANMLFLHIICLWLTNVQLGSALCTFEIKDKNIKSVTGIEKKTWDKKKGQNANLLKC